MQAVTAKPFIKWAGGKGQLLSAIAAQFPYSAQDKFVYVEPFVGSGAVLFWVLNQFPKLEQAIINDINSDLTNTYQSIKNQVEDLILVLEKLQNEFYQRLDDEQAKSAYYYQKRELFNQRSLESLEQSALFIFLNRTCFNGLYRVNSRNEFNVPIGRYKKPNICNPENLQAVSKALQKVSILNTDFEKTLEHTQKPALFYFDPPYKPLSKTANFNSYANQKFDNQEQIRLKNFCDKLSQLNHQWILSNSDTRNAEEEQEMEFFDDLFDGYQINRVHAKRKINSNAQKREGVTELLVSNIHGEKMTFNSDKINGREPLVDYPWRSEIDRLLDWLLNKDSHIQAFCFDLIMSASYIDATAGIEKSIEQCDAVGKQYNAHIGFINLCSPCYINKEKWSYQKAVKPQSGALGKLSSEVILRFIEKLHPKLSEVIAVGGTEAADAILKHDSGIIILAEVKSAPLLTYPFLFNVPKNCLNGNHEKIIITNSQLRACDSAIFLHGVGAISLGIVGSELWPFKPLVDFLINQDNMPIIKASIDEWTSARTAYASKNRENKMYYLANASGNPPKIAIDRDGWPKKESISDSKTSAGMDRTDDIKKGIYQSLKIGTYLKDEPNIKTAIISNLPAYRHGNEYIDPFIDILWGLEQDLSEENGKKAIFSEKLRRAFDFIITLEEPVLRDIEL